jgi:hypothetical protein
VFGRHPHQTIEPTWQNFVLANWTTSKETIRGTTKKQKATRSGHSFKTAPPLAGPSIHHHIQIPNHFFILP